MCKYPFVWDTQENFQKQTLRTRFSIVDSQGLQVLSLSVDRKRKTGEKTIMDQVKILDLKKTQKKHFHALCTAYNRSPFFEYYRDDLEQFYQLDLEFLIEFNQKSIAFVIEKLQLQNDLQEKKTNVENPLYPSIDFEQTDNLFAYQQTFHAKNGFVVGASILDFLFHLGPKETKRRLLI